MATPSTRITQFIYGIHVGHAIRLGQTVSDKARAHTIRRGPRQVTARSGAGQLDRASREQRLP